MTRADERPVRNQLADRPEDASFGELARRAITHLTDAGTPEPPIVLAYHPLVRNNPFQALLYGRCFEHGIAAIPIATLDALADAGVVRALGAEVWLHLHWIAPVLEGATDAKDVKRRVDSFLARLDELRASGVKVAWTVHNLLPHDAIHRDQETRLRRGLVERCDVVHCLGEDTPQLAAGLFEIPSDRVEVVSHPSYLGIYPRTMSPSQARFELGLSPSDTVLAAIGAIKPYKGLDAMLDAFDEASATDPGLRLIVAGPVGGDEANALRVRCEANPRIVSRLGRIAEADMQRFLEAADAVVLTHDAVLNSGVFFLALTFERPVIAFRHGSLTREVAPDLGVLVEPGDRAGLVSAFSEASTLKDPKFRAAAGVRARELAPDKVSDAFSQMIRRRTR